MKPNFALNLSHDGIGLAHRTASGWQLVGEVSLDAPDLTEQLAQLRRVALQHAPEGMLTKLIIPASQVLYIEIDAPGPRSAQRRKQIAAALDGVTPYAVDDLVFDWSGHGDVVQVAVVARETLAEAESFAEDWGFNPVALISLAPQGSFAGEPWFGPSSVAAVHLPEGARVERDQDSLGLMAALAQATFAPPQAPEAALQPDTLATVEALLATTPDETPPEEIDLPGLEAALSAPLESLPGAASAHEDEADDLDASLQAALDAPLPEAPPQPVAPEAIFSALPEIWESPEEEETALEAAAEEAPDSGEAAADLAPAPPEAPEEPPEAEAEAPPAPEQSETEAEPETEAEAEAEVTPAPDEATQEPEPEGAPEPQKTVLPEAETETAPAPTFSSRRPALGAAETESTLAPPRALGGAARLHPVAAPEGKALFARSGKAGITAPGLALPPDPPAADHPAQRLGKAAKARLQRAAAGTVAFGGSAGRALAQNLRNRKVSRVASAETGKATAPTTDQTARDKTVFGGRKPRSVGGKPKHLGLVLSGGLAAFLLLVALWSSFIGESDTQAPAPEQAATAPADMAPAPEAAAEVPPQPFEPPAESEVAAREPAPAEPAPEAVPPEPEPSVAAAEPVVVPELPALEPLRTAPVAPQPATQLAALSTANAALAPLAPLAPLGSPEAPLLAAPRPEAPQTQPELMPTPEGTLSPNGFMLYAGRPPAVPRARPAAIVAAATAPYADPALAGKRPKARPASVEAAAAAAQPAPQAPAPQPNDGAALPPAPRDANYARLAALRPKARPAAVEAAAKAATAAAAAAAEQAAPAETTGSSLAVAVSRRPLARPRNFRPAVEEALAAAIAAEPHAPVAAPAPAPAPKASAPAPAVELDEPEPTRAAPKLPTSASVAKQATEKNALALNEVNLIGLYGTAKNRRALVRLANGRFVKVAVGDRLDGGKVTAIGTSQLTYQKGARSVTLKLLKGS